MKVVLKTVVGKQQEITVEETDTVAEIKKILQDEYDVDSLRLCFNGNVLNEAGSLKEQGLKENDVVIIAGRKRKIPKPLTTQTPSPLKAEPSAPAVGAPAVSERASPPPFTSEQPSAAAAATGPASSTTDTTGAPVTQPPPQLTVASSPSATSANTTMGTLIDEVVSMGFDDRQQVMLALRAAYMDVGRAVEYLCEGIPPHLVEQLSHADTPAQHAADSHAHPSSSSTGNQLVADSGAQASLQVALQQIPQFEEIRTLYHTNRNALPVILQQIAQNYPAIYQLIEQEPSAFLAIINEVGSPASTTMPSTVSLPSPSMVESTSGDFVSRLASEAEVTEEDRAAIQQLMEVGGGMWDEDSALLGYLAMGRNSEMAASFLFENAGIPANILAEMLMRMQAETEDMDLEDD